VVVDLPDKVRERAHLGARQGDCLVAAVPVRASPRGAAARQRSPDHRLPDARLPVCLLRPAARAGARPGLRGPGRRLVNSGSRCGPGPP